MDLITIDTWADAQPHDYRPDLESGNVLFFPATPFSLPEATKELLRSLDFSGTAVHKNIAYRPASDRITGVDAGAEEQLRAVFKDYSRNVVRFAADLLPDYAKKWKLDYASFRPLEEQGRDLPTNKRNDLMHTDAFPSRPVHGNLILRIFTNIHPTKSRVWVTSDPFTKVAERYAKDAGLDDLAAEA
ncbi:MAG TPA: Kdo hydroxylase family protein, partial [Bryobacteraceae bacterium]|nr:Kdo hydroxylase family protein [Bryobacteraceae bacterium]